MSTTPDAQAPQDPQPSTGRPLSLLRLATGNYVSLFGLAVVAGSIVLLATFALFQLLAEGHNPYFDIVGFMILPGVLVGGLLIVPLGMWLDHRRRRRYQRRTGKPAPRWQIDLSDRRTRDSLLGFLFLSIFIVVPVLAVSTYHSYHYTESTYFCGQTCHEVMEPQATAHANSPHARVRCAECHIGAGAGWFVKSKLSGVRQVFAVALDTYQRPIPPAIHHLRPARDTCEECHWPAKFFGSQLRERVHYSPDEQNTRRVVRMLLKVGGADEATGRIEGIHMHMALYGKVEYVALDDTLQEIPWVRYTTPDGRVTVYRSDGLSSSDPPPSGQPMRTVDCMDCHNRGAHHFQSPQAAVNLYMDAGKLDASLPYLKRESVLALIGDYPDRPAARAGIRRRLSAFYEQQYPQVWQEQRAAIEQAADVLVGVYERNFFPEMRVDWRTYPENIGHLNSHGCLRCHDGLHVADDGTAVSTDCSTCHTFLNPVPGQPDAFVPGEFQHSMDLTKHPNLRCSQCHNGGRLLQCRDCHASGEWLETYGQGAFSPTDAPTSAPGPQPE